MNTQNIINATPNTPTETTKTVIPAEFEGTYEVNVKPISDGVKEIEVLHIDWADLHAETSKPAFHILITPQSVMSITDLGLDPIRDESRLWACIPKIWYPTDDCPPYYADFRAAEEVIEYIMTVIKETCPEWNTPVPGRRQSRRHSK